MNTSEVLQLVSNTPAPETAPETAPEAAVALAIPKEPEAPKEPVPITRDDLMAMGKTIALRVATEALHRSLKTLFLPNQIVELRALDVTTPEKRMAHIDSGYYDNDHHDQLIERALWLQRNAQAKGVYVTLQNLRPVLLARRANRSAPAKETTADHDVVRYRWLPVDLDMHPSVRPSGISSSPSQWVQIHNMAGLLRVALLEQGWPQPVYADSGNGAHLLWRVDLATSDAGLLSRVLGAIYVKAKEMDQDVEVDLKNYNPARIWKLYGTLACKGDHMPFAPHRLSRILEAPEQPEVLTQAQMEDLCTRWGQVAPKHRKSVSSSNGALATTSTLPTSTPPTSKQQPSTERASGSWSVEGWAPKVGLELPEAQVFHSHTGPGQKWNLKPCPCDRKCPDGAAIQQAGDGAVSFRCHHNTCEVRSWDDLRTLLGDPKRARSGHSHPQAQIATQTPPTPRPAVSSKPSEDQTQTTNVGLWETALEVWVEIFRKEGAESRVTMENFAALVEPLVAEWEQLPASALRPETILARLPKVATNPLVEWTRRVDRLFAIASLRVRQPNLLRTDDDRAATLLRAAASEDNRVSAELGALDEPWRVALKWVARASEDAREERVEIFFHVLRQTNRWLNRSVVEEMCVLAHEANIEQSAILDLLPETIRPPERQQISSPAKTRRKTKGNPATETPANLVRVLDVFPDAPVGRDMVIPEPYVVKNNAIGQITHIIKENGEKEELFNEHIHSPLLITASQHDSNGVHWLTLTWLRLGVWSSLTVERSVICDRNKIVSALSCRGAPADSTNAHCVIKWLIVFERLNLRILPKARVSERMGWQKGKGFLLGHLWINAEGEYKINVNDPNTWRPGAWALATECGADRVDARAFSEQAGTMEGWIQNVSQIIKFPKVLLAIYASLTGPMISLLGGRTPIVDWSGPAGSGKTSTLRLAASVWGNPSEFEGRVIGGWNTTAVAIERRASLLGHLPLILNDSNKALDSLPRKVIYELAEGVGKQRGMRAGGREKLSCWSTIILSTGESRLLDFAKASDVGATHRVLSLHGSPWGAGSHAQEVKALREGLSLHYGHAGRKLLRWVAEQKAKHLEAWRARRNQITSDLQQQACNQVMAERLAEDVAAILLTAELAHQALALTWPVQQAQDAIRSLFADLTTTSEQPSAHRSALTALWEWCWSHQDAFWGRRKVDAPPAQGWAGRWDHVEQWEELYIIPSIADKYLESLGYKPMSIRREWIDAGYLRRGEGRNLLPSIRIDGGRMRCLAITRKAIEEVCSLDE